MLNNSKWKTLETRRFHTKVTLMYKILNDLSAPQLSNSFVKLNDSNINYNLRNIETDLALQRPCTNFLKHSFKYSGAMLWNNLSLGKDRTVVVGFQTQSCFFAFHAFYWIALISYFKCIYNILPYSDFM